MDFLECLELPLIGRYLTLIRDSAVFTFYSTPTACFRREKTEKIVKKLRATFKQTLFGDDISIVPFSCHSPEEGSSTDEDFSASNKDTLMATLRTKVVDVLTASKNTAGELSRTTPDQFLFAVDHCFSIKGKPKFTFQILRILNNAFSDIHILPILNDGF